SLMNASFPPFLEIRNRQPMSLSIVDFNNDGKKDIFLGGIEDEGFIIGYKNNGENNFQQAYYTRTYPIYDLAFGKFNNDNQPDLFLSSGRGNGVLFGTNNFSFSGYTNRDFNVIQPAVTVGDFNSDGLDDFAVWAHIRRELRVFINNESGLPNLPRIYKFKGEPYTRPNISLINADFNGDGKLDIAINFYEESRIRILYGLGGGAFARGDIFQVNKYPYSLAAADFNNDGKLDLAVTNNQDSPNKQLDILINTTSNNKESK
ncbi:MAG: VCBS repeat-containing protein, partial [Pyrinomonadaceae bacterium]|nr:VCBS repeat-containing protein [Pyrinomonadaceae bacterium]